MEATSNLAGRRPARFLPGPRRPPRPGWAVFTIMPPFLPPLFCSIFSESAALGGVGCCSGHGPSGQVLSLDSRGRGHMGSPPAPDPSPALTGVGGGGQGLTLLPAEGAVTRALEGDMSPTHGDPRVTGEAQPSSQGALDEWRRHSPALGEPWTDEGGIVQLSEALD